MSDTYNIGPTVPALFAAHERRYAEAQGRIAGLEAELAEAQDKALRFDLDQAGIERRESESVELVELRAELAEAEDRAVDVGAAIAIRMADELEARDFVLAEREKEIERLKAEKHRAYRAGHSDGRNATPCEAIRMEHEIERLRGDLNDANGVADLAIKHRDHAEAQWERLSALLAEADMQYAAERADKAELHATYQATNMRLREELDKARLPEELIERLRKYRIHTHLGLVDLCGDILASVGEQP